MIEQVSFRVLACVLYGAGDHRRVGTETPASKRVSMTGRRFGSTAFISSLLMLSKISEALAPPGGNEASAWIRVEALTRVGIQEGISFTSIV